MAIFYIDERERKPKEDDLLYIKETSQTLIFKDGEWKNSEVKIEYENSGC